MTSEDRKAEGQEAEDLQAIQRQAAEDFYRAEKERSEAESAAQAEATNLVSREDSQAIDLRAKVAALAGEAQTAWRESDAELMALGLGGVLERGPVPVLPDDAFAMAELEEAVARARAARSAIAQVGKDWQLEQIRIKLAKEAEQERLRLAKEAEEERLRLEAEALKRRIGTTATVVSWLAFVLTLGGLYLWSQWPERVMWLADSLEMIIAFDLGCVALIASLGAWAVGRKWDWLMTVGLLAGGAALAWCVWRDDPSRTFGLMVAITGLAWPVSVAVYRSLAVRYPKAYVRLAPVVLLASFALCALISVWVGLAQQPAAATESRAWNNVREARSRVYYWLAEGHLKGETVFVTVKGGDTAIDAKLYALAPNEKVGNSTLVRTVKLEPNTELRLAFVFGGSIRILPDEAVRYTPKSPWQTLILEAGAGTYQVTADGATLPPIVEGHAVTITMTPAPDG